MIHDLELIDKIGNLPQTKFDDHVFRATGISADPTAPSTSGGRWAPSSNDEPPIRVLYTSFEKEGAIAELACYLAELNPKPAKSLKVHELAVTTSKTLGPYGFR